MSRLLFAILTVAVLSPATLAQAHFPWIVLDGSSGQANVYFGETAAPDDPELLKQLDGLKLFAPGERGELKEFATKLDDAALVAEVPQAQTVVLSHRFGKVNRRGESVLMHFDAKAHAAPLSGTWTTIQNTERLPLEIIARLRGRQVELNVLLEGQPLADAPLYISGAGLDNIESQTDNEGSFVCQPPADGLLEVRAKLRTEEPGEYAGHKYTSSRHWSTLTVPVHLPTMQSVPHELAPLSHGITSFGAAVAGDWLYLYGGQVGGAHHYWREGQSPDFMRLNLHSTSEWEKLPGGPRRTGTALVSHAGLLYRVGGFEARNDEKGNRIVQRAF